MDEGGDPERPSDRMWRPVVRDAGAGTSHGGTAGASSADDGFSDHRPACLEARARTDLAPAVARNSGNLECGPCVIVAPPPWERDRGDDRVGEAPSAEAEAASSERPRGPFHGLACMDVPAHGVLALPRSRGRRRRRPRALPVLQAPAPGSRPAGLVPRIAQKEHAMAETSTPFPSDDLALVCECGRRGGRRSMHEISTIDGAATTCE